MYQELYISPFVPSPSGKTGSEIIDFILPEILAAEEAISFIPRQINYELNEYRALSMRRDSKEREFIGQLKLAERSE